MKNPNGFGSVLKLGGKRRKPFAARVTDGWEINKDTGKVKQKFKYIGYYKSRPEAMIALAEYNKNPYDIDNKKVTFEDVFNLWKNEKYPNFSESNIRGYNAAYNLSSDLHNNLFKDIRKAHMQSVVDNKAKSHSMKKRTKTFFNQLYKYALENDVVEKDYSKFVEVGKNISESKKEPFSKAEIEKLWINLNQVENVDIALILIYTGMRPSELLEVENDSINLEKRYLIGGMKTEAGTDRIIPINKKILPLIEKRMDENNQYLIVSTRGTKMSYNTLRMKRWIPLMNELNMDHTPHECRHTFATLMDNAGANKLSIKRIMGHATQDITDDIYTHKNLEELLKAIDLI